MTDNTRGKLYASMVSFIFGFSFIFTKKGLDSASLLNLLGWRFILAFLFLDIYRRTKGLKLNFKRDKIYELFLLGLFFPVLYYTLESLGIKVTTASEAGVILSLGPIVTVILVVFVLRELPRKSQILGICLSTLGVIIMVLAKKNQPSFSFYGYIMLFLGIISYGFYAVLQRKIQGFTVYERTYFMLFMGALVFFGGSLFYSLLQGEALTFLTLPFSNRDFLLSVTYLSFFSSNLAFLLDVTALGLIGPTATTSFAGLTTLVSVLAGVLILGESFLLQQWIAAGLIILGVYTANK